MTRIVKPAKLDSKLHRNLAPDLEDGFGWFMTSAVFLIGTGIGSTLLAINFSLLFILLMLAPIAFAATGINVYKHTFQPRSYDRSLYYYAYENLKSITEPNSLEDAKVLATNVWDHERALGTMDKGHNNKYDCADCQKRVDLIAKLRQTQPVPSFDGSDIERIEAKIAARKELGV